jgi:hypothetical protein
VPPSRGTATRAKQQKGKKIAADAPALSDQQRHGVFGSLARRLSSLANEINGILIKKLSKSLSGGDSRAHGNHRLTLEQIATNGGQRPADRLKHVNSAVDVPTALGSIHDF